MTNPNTKTEERKYDRDREEEYYEGWMDGYYEGTKAMYNQLTKNKLKRGVDLIKYLSKNISDSESKLFLEKIKKSIDRNIGEL